MENGKCSNDYPKPFSDVTMENVNGYPLYKRRDDGLRVIARGAEVDNRWIVPYNPYLTLKYNAHVNVEICSSIKSVKYLYKYIYKGHDSASLELRESVLNEATLEYDEISTYISSRYVSAPEAVWRLLEKPLHDQSHSIYRLAVHDNLKQNVTFQPGREEAAIAMAAARDTSLTAWFRLNAADNDARQFLYR